jgi:hypothetical protein
MVYVDDARPVAVPVIEVKTARQRFAQWANKIRQVLDISVIGDSYSAGQDFYLNELTQRLARGVWLSPGLVMSVSTTVRHWAVRTSSTPAAVKSTSAVIGMFPLLGKRVPTVEP